MQTNSRHFKGPIGRAINRAIPHYGILAKIEGCAPAPRLAAKLSR
jgi:hypothetical protein